MGIDWYRKLHRGLRFLFSPMFSIRVQAWMLARIMRSSSALESSRQLFRFASTVSSENWLEHGPSFAPFEHPQPFCRNFLTLSIICYSFSFWSSFASAMVNRWSFTEWLYWLLSWSLTQAKCYRSNVCNHWCLTGSNWRVKQKRGNIQRTRNMRVANDARKKRACSEATSISTSTDIFRASESCTCNEHKKETRVSKERSRNSVRQLRWA